VDAVLRRAPAVALVDELAHTNVPGSCNTKRWQDVEELLTAGIDVISTVNIQHLESLGDVVESITGVRQRETVPARWYGGPTRLSWSTCPRRPCADAWRTATSTTRTRSTPPSPTASGPAT
jgi:2-iminoacetate synthase ThiH